MIKLKKLLNLTEQAPQPPVPETPEKAQAAPSTEEPSNAPAPDTGDEVEAPTPESASEYDFTRDFRSFEDTRNKAEAEAKKKFLAKANKMLLGKKITANASRGYGQPKTDHTIEKVAKVSLDFWYKDWVVIVADENGKKFFLTPGINIKIESAATEPSEEEPEEPEAPKPEVPGELPTAGGPPAPTEEPPAPETPTQVGAPEAPPAEPKNIEKTVPTAPEPAAPTKSPDSKLAPSEKEPVVPQKKKKKSVPPTLAETKKPYNKQDINRDFGNLFYSFLSDDFKKRTKGRFDLTPYLIEAYTETGGEDGGYTTVAEFQIPKEIFTEGYEPRDFKLEMENDIHHTGGPGEPYSRGYVDVQPVGRTYLFKIEITGGRDI